MSDDWEYIKAQQIVHDWKVLVCGSHFNGLRGELAGEDELVEMIAKELRNARNQNE